MSLLNDAELLNEQRLKALVPLVHMFDEVKAGHITTNGPIKSVVWSSCAF